jgi:hypothetical protein
MEELNNFDYKIITIDSDYAFFSSSEYCDFYIKLDEALKNVYKINIITMLLSIPNSSSLNTPLNQIFVNLNNYSRLIAKKNSVIDGNRANINVFDSIIVENQITDISSTNYTTLKNDYNSSDSIYYLNPIEPQLIRFSVKLTDNDNALIAKTAIKRFVIKLGVYYTNKKTTRI